MLIEYATCLYLSLLACLEGAPSPHLWKVPLGLMMASWTLILYIRMSFRYILQLSSPEITRRSTKVVTGKHSNHLRRTYALGSARAGSNPVCVVSFCCFPPCFIILAPRRPNFARGMEAGTTVIVSTSVRLWVKEASNPGPPPQSPMVSRVLLPILPFDLPVLCFTSHYRKAMIA